MRCSRKPYVIVLVSKNDGNISSVPILQRKQMSDLYLAELHRLRVIYKQSILQSRNPEISLAVAIQRNHGFVICT